ncbi:hypothetical protein GCM10010168_40900 [Actinoplanes ianthinogenes]|uniref:WD40 repeat domain-containing protein n=1 Tax=Actinoplanes ianthinogenes TaxID=122358 RepID=A0ABM7LWP7_9ACTN|nr:WD40 repeat domain-containing protein [Actinoplanes ianthinogenes]BCJ43601.1 hypothetical protein Aiant_42580 [Actinoplanes ianthinogenes]GGR18944.1 hypothetical protein GCM10010168_40900 [Actinoplanes ianthinogenes]
MRHLEDRLRDTVGDLAASAPLLNDMAMVARIRGRRIRRRRQTVLGAAVILLAGMVITPYAVFHGHRDGRRPQPVASVPPSRLAVPTPSTTVTVPKIRKDWWNAPVELPGGVVVTSVGRKDPGTDANGTELPSTQDLQHGNVALNRVTGRYQLFHPRYQAFVGAPTGRYVLVADEGAGRNYAPVGFLNAVTGKVRLLDHGSGSGAVEWSADGRKALVTLFEGGIRVMDAKTGTEKETVIYNGTAFCPDYCFYTWLPGGKEVAIAQRDPNVPRSEATQSTVKTIDVYSVASGKLVRTLPVPGVPAGSAAWSPDGRYVVLLPDASEENGMRIAEVATGRVVGIIPIAAFNYPAVTSQVRFLGNDQVLALNGRDAGVYDLTGKRVAGVQLPADFADRAVSLGVG